MKRNNRHHINESEETRYVDAEEGLELLEQGYELRGRGIYGSYRFAKDPGSDKVDFWYLDRDNWDNGSWTTDEFLDNMTAIGSVKLLYVSKAPRIQESESSAGNPTARDYMDVLLQAIEESRVNPEEVQSELAMYDDPDELLAAYERGDLVYCDLEREFAKLLPVPADTKEWYDILNDLWNNAYDILDEAMQRTEDEMRNSRTYFGESVRPAGNPRGRRKLDESIDYGSLSQRDQQRMDRLVENLRGAKGTLEALCYRGDVEDDVTRGELIEMHMSVCKMLDKLPW